METAGGMMASQLAATAAVTHPAFTELADFVYCRKRKKGSGTCQQLEGPQFVTARTPVRSVFAAPATTNLRLYSVTTLDKNQHELQLSWTTHSRTVAALWDHPFTNSCSSQGPPIHEQPHAPISREVVPRELTRQ